MQVRRRFIKTASLALAASPALAQGETSLIKSITKEVGFHQVFDPPADFVPWEHDDSPQYVSLPAGGRLAFAYRVIFEQTASARYLRITFRAQQGWGQLLSEIESREQNL